MTKDAKPRAEKTKLINIKIILWHVPKIFCLLFMIKIITKGNITISNTPTKLPTRETNLCSTFSKQIAKIVTTEKNKKFTIFPYLNLFFYLWVNVISCLIANFNSEVSVIISETLFTSIYSSKSSV